MRLDPLPSVDGVPHNAPWWPTHVQQWTFHSPRPEVLDYVNRREWQPPERRICFLTDMHADADAFLRSLDASGGIVRTGNARDDYKLSRLGEQSTFVLGGDCLDKGPSNLGLLRALNLFRGKGARLVSLAGNHDLRTLLGLNALGQRETRWQHLFARMGRKTMRLLEEVYDETFAEGPPQHVLCDSEVRQRLFPPAEWYERFPLEAQGVISPKKLRRESQRIREKVADIEAFCEEKGWRLGDLYAAMTEARRLFLEPDGEFFWFFSEMDLCFRAGSLLFIHAGLDDTVAATIAQSGVAGVNAQYHRLLRKDLFELYHGPLGGCFRTKYRDIDYPLTAEGVANVHAAGISAIVHGHRNTKDGQRMVMRAGMLNFECDASVDANTRRLEGLAGPGGAVTVFNTEGQVFGISADADHVKFFDPKKPHQI